LSVNADGTSKRLCQIGPNFPSEQRIEGGWDVLGLARHERILE
jgi:hypothetical protein